MLPRPKILFMCVANSCRSQMAEALARHYLGGNFEIYSAGSAPTQVNPNALKVLQERGLDTTGLYSKSFDEVPQEVDYAISLCSEQELSCPIFPSTVERLSWPMPVACAEGRAEEAIQTFREVRDAIAERILEFWNEGDSQ